MRVLMLGWEFPPYISGGLGTACLGLTRGLSSLGTEVLFLLPRPPERTPAESPVQFPNVANITQPNLPAQAAVDGPTTDWQAGANIPTSEIPDVTVVGEVVMKAIASRMISPYARPAVDRSETITTTTKVSQPSKSSSYMPASMPPAPAYTPTPTVTFLRTHGGGGDHYAGDLFAETNRYAALAAEVAKREDFDVIHAHDWMTFPAALAVAGATGKPLIVHVHSTEFDRAGAHVDSRIYEIERKGMHAAVRVIAVSRFTKRMVEHHYGIDPDKVDVVYNATTQLADPSVAAPPAAAATRLPPGTALGEIPSAASDPLDDAAAMRPAPEKDKIVLFLGRITMQKGPDYFLAAAKKVLEVMPNVTFVMAGSGDMATWAVETAAQLGIGHKVRFTGFLRGLEVEQAFGMADLYVMPSVSEPFGITPLEAMRHDVPVIISRQSGVSEVLNHALKVDFWDTDDMADKMVAVLKHKSLSTTMRQFGKREVQTMNWADSAKVCMEVYVRAQQNTAAASQPVIASLAL